MTIPHFIDVPEERPALQARDQNVFRPMQPDSEKEFAKRSFNCSTVPSRYGHSKDDYWSPPLYRNKSLLSCPSSGVGTWTHHGNLSNDENSDFLNQTPFEVPSDFIPPKHSFSAPSKEEEGCERVLEPFPLRDTDVVCGRGANTMLHPGNRNYRELIKKHETDYICARRSDKPMIAMRIIDRLNSQGVRFVRREKDSSSGGMLYWVEIGETKVYEKVCQSLREGAPELRRKMLSSASAHNSHHHHHHHTRQPDYPPMHQQYRAQYSYSPMPCY